MSTSTTPETSPNAPVSVPGLSFRSLETAPSAVVSDGPTVARMIGFFGLFLLILGVVVVAATRAAGPRWVSEGWGFMFAALGLALMLYHSAVDADVEIRRVYGGFALFLLLVSLVVSVISGAPAASDGVTVPAKYGFYFLPWGCTVALVGLLFSYTFCRHETDEVYLNAATTGLLVIGTLLTVGSAAAGIFKSDFLVGPGIAMAVLGVGFLSAYLARVETSEGVGYTVAFSLGAVGAAIVCYALARSAFPTLLFEGSSVLRTPKGTLDPWKVISRLLYALAFLTPAILALFAKTALWFRVTLGAIGLVGAGVVATSLVSHPVHSQPLPFFVPDGLILMGMGFFYLTIALAICSDNQIVALTRRELSSYFQSPIGYLVLAGMFLMHWLSYWLFVSMLESFSTGPRAQAIPEPILESYIFAIIPVFVLLLVVPALTMRLLSEEMRSGSLEVLLTAPVDEWPIVFSKFVGTWIFYMITWLPAGLLLLALRIETGVPFDYRPLLSFYCCLAAQGLAFVGMGLFFSSLTKNQIVAAVLTFAGMMFFLVCFLLQRTMSGSLPPFLQTVMARLAFPNMWGESLSGRLPLRDVLLYSSIGFFWLFLSVKVLETRKWS